MLSQILKYDKRFLIIGNQNAFAYKEVFPYLKSGEIRTGYNMVKKFIQPDGSTKQFGNICWFTNLPVKRHNEKLILYEVYDSEKYPKYENFDAINVDSYTKIPKDYDGYMGVPVTLVEGNRENIKITTPFDKIIGEVLASKQDYV